jgi:hypothetical protein
MIIDCHVHTGTDSQSGAALDCAGVTPVQRESADIFECE